VALELLGFVMLTIGSPTLTTCVQRNGPASGKALRAQRDGRSGNDRIHRSAEAGNSVCSARIGWGCKPVPRCAATLSGHGLSWPMICVACGLGNFRPFSADLD